MKTITANGSFMALSSCELVATDKTLDMSASDFREDDGFGKIGCIYADGELPATFTNSIENLNSFDQPLLVKSVYIFSATVNYGGVETLGI